MDSFFRNLEPLAQEATASSLLTPRVKEVHTKAGHTPYPWSPRLRGVIQ